MAVARHVQIAAAKDGIVAVQRDVIIDPKSGIAAEVEKVVVAVDAGGGKVAVMEQARVKAIAVPNPVTTRAITAPRRDPPPQFKATTTTPSKDAPQPVPLQVFSSPRRDPSPLRFKQNDSEFCGFLQTLVSFGCLLFSAISLVLIVAPAVGGTLSCDPLMKLGEIIIAIGAFALITTLCCSLCCCVTKAVATDDMETVQAVFVVCCFVAGIPLIVFLGLAIGGSVLVAENYDVVRNGTYVDGDGELVSCKNSEMPFILTVIAGALWLLLCSCGCLSLCNRKEK